LYFSFVLLIGTFKKNYDTTATPHMRKIFKNGDLQKSQSTTVTFNVNGPITIGRSLTSTTDAMKGAIDELLIYNIALRDVMLNNIYNNFAEVNTAGRLVWLAFNEGSASTVINDYALTTRKLTIYGSPLFENDDSICAQTMATTCPAGETHDGFLTITDTNQYLRTKTTIKLDNSFSFSFWIRRTINGVACVPLNVGPGSVFAAGKMFSAGYASDYFQVTFWQNSEILKVGPFPQDAGVIEKQIKQTKTIMNKNTKSKY
jgi:hypothetical protein